MRRALPSSIQSAAVLLASVLLAWGLVLPAAVAQPPEDEEEEDCSPSLVEGPVEITPAFGSSLVPLNAGVRVRYSEGYFEATGIPVEEVFRLLRCDEGLADCLTRGQPVPGRISLVLETVLFEPTSLLTPATQYLAVAEGITDDFEAPFQTVALGADEGGIDADPPDLAPITSFEASEISPSCEAPNGGFRIDVTLPAAAGELAVSDVEYLLYLTRGPGVEEPELRARVRGVPNEIVMAFVLQPDEVVSPICVEVQAVDIAGNLGAPTPVQCRDPIEGNFFEPLCSAGEARGVPTWMVGVVAALLGLGRRRKRRARP